MFGLGLAYAERYARQTVLQALVVIASQGQ